MPRAPKLRASKCAHLSSGNAKVWLWLVSESLADFPVSKSKDLQLLCPWPDCEKYFTRDQDWDRHIISFHLPDNLCCPNPGCPWRGHREDYCMSHIKKGTCGSLAIPEWEHQRMIYDPKLILDWILDEAVSFEVAVQYALDFVQERARELGKADLWRDPWRYDGK